MNKHTDKQTDRFRAHAMPRTTQSTRHSHNSEFEEASTHKSANSHLRPWPFWPQNKWIFKSQLGTLFILFIVHCSCVYLSDCLFDSPLYSFITPFLFHSLLKTNLFHKSYPRIFTSSSRTAFTNYCPDRFFWASRFWFLVFPHLFVSVPCAKLGWPSRHLLSARKYTVPYRIVS